MRPRLVWKLSAVVVAILTVAIALSGYASDLICAHYSLESARAFLRFNTESIIKGIGHLMMSRNNEGIDELIAELSQDSKVYGDIQLVAHPSGEIASARFGGKGRKLNLQDRACAVCHGQDDLSDADLGITDTVIRRPEGDRVLSIIAPILNESGCRSADCHAHTDDPPILGFLNADYSLQRMDATVTDRRVLILVTVLVSLLSGVIVLRLMFTRLLERPISGLIAGTKRIVANQLDFRFEQKRNDEVGELEEAFNTMTARIRAHRSELRSAMEYLGGIVESSADIIITATPEGYIETFNRGAERTLGYSRVEVIGQPVKILFADPRERDAAVAQLEDTDNVRNYETRFLAKDGKIRNVLLTLSRLRDRKGNAIGTFGISKDITHEKQLQQELVQAHRFAAIGQAVTGIQHAIKNMLNALKGGTYVVRTGMAKDDQPLIKEGWNMIEEGIELISSLSINMLNYAKEWKPELQRVYLNDLMTRIYALNRQAAADQGVALRHEVSEALTAVLCDPKLIHMATADILINAVEACTWKEYGSDESPQVVLKSFLREDSPQSSVLSAQHFVIEISDNGCGMTEEIRQNIFTPFFSTKKTLGTGLGLALSARIINVHGGEISVESEPDRGSVFRIYLPIDGPKGREEASDGQAGPGS